MQRDNEEAARMLRHQIKALRNDLESLRDNVNDVVDAASTDASYREATNFAVGKQAELVSDVGAREALLDRRVTQLEGRLDWYSLELERNSLTGSVRDFAQSVFVKSRKVIGKTRSAVRGAASSLADARSMMSMHGHKVAMFVVYTMVIVMAASFAAGRQTETPLAVAPSTVEVAVRPTWRPTMMMMAAPPQVSHTVPPLHAKITWGGGGYIRASR